MLAIAAVLYQPTDRVETLMAEVAHALRADGVSIGGVLQHECSTPAASSPCTMEMENLATAERFALSQNLGPGSEACRLDTASLAHAAMAVRQAIERGTELILINKFGAQEAAGGGLRAEMGLVVAAGIPLLTAVASRFHDDWLAFTGGAGRLLQPELRCVLDWSRQVRQEHP